MAETGLKAMAGTRRPKFGHFIVEFATPGIGHIMKSAGCDFVLFDVLLWNAKREATELTRGNLVVELDRRRVTPPLDCGLLPGTLRGELLEVGEIEEHVVTLADVQRASRLWFINALRGWVPITLVGGS